MSVNVKTTLAASQSQYHLNTRILEAMNAPGLYRIVPYNRVTRQHEAYKGVDGVDAHNNVPCIDVYIVPNSRTGKKIKNHPCNEFDSG